MGEGLKRRVLKMWVKSLLLSASLILLAGLSARTAKAESEQPLYEKAESLYSEGEFEEACKRFKEFLNLYPHAPVELRHNAMEHMGIGYRILEAEKEAREAFLMLLAEEPTRRLDELYVLPDVVNFYEAIRNEFLQTHPYGEVRKLQPFYYSLLPFGVGQLFNDQPVKGGVIMSAELATIGLSLFAYYQKTSLCESHQGGTCLTDSQSKHKRWETIQKTSAFLAAGLMIYGFVDGVLFYREREEPITLRPVLPMPDEGGWTGGIEIAWRF